MSIMNIVRVDSWNGLVDELFSESYNPSLGRYRSHEAYRGLSDNEYQLETTLMRLQGDYVKLEKHLLRNFRKYGHRTMVEQDSLWHWLALAQHHGLPTRLLDWTYSPFVAMHFATANIEKYHLDGVVWAVNYHKVHNLLPDRLTSQLASEGANVFTVELLAESLPTVESLDAFAEEEFTLFMEPPSMDDRIVNQHGFFSVMPSSKGRLESVIEANPDVGRKIIIPAELKWEVRDKLDQANITERVLFPGLDGLSSWLKRQYSPKLLDDC